LWFYCLTCDESQWRRDIDIAFLAALATISKLLRWLWQRFLYCCSGGFGDSFCVVVPEPLITVCVLYRQLWWRFLYCTGIFSDGFCFVFSEPLATVSVLFPLLWRQFLCFHGGFGDSFCIGKSSSGWSISKYFFSETARPNELKLSRKHL
jgi:hypothetical protein